MGKLGLALSGNQMMPVVPMMPMQPGFAQQGYSSTGADGFGCGYGPGSDGGHMMQPSSMQ